MYTLSEIRTIHLEVTSKCQASCPMCARNLQGGMDNPFITLTEITLAQFKQWVGPELVKQLDKLYMCGNLGDPIIAKDTLEIFKYCRELNPTMALSMNTNGSARSKSFWEQLGELKVSIKFGIDGLEDTHSIYRRGTDFNTIINNAVAFIQAGGHASWEMLVFSHNSHQVELAKKLSTELGFAEFHSKNTSRFKEDILIVLDKTGKPVDKISSTDRSKKIAEETISRNLEEPVAIIQCKVQKEKSMYISAGGYVSPCCWLDVEWMPHVNATRIDYMDKINKFKNLHDQTLAEIFDSGFFNEIEQGWGCDPLRECKKQCGSMDRFNEQFK